MKFRRPQIVPLLFTVGAVLVLSTLGLWQVQRLAWKEGLIADIAAAQALPPLTGLPEDLAGAAYRKLSLSGTFLYDKVLRTPSSLPGVGAGYFLLTPFALSDGRHILVNRGFAPAGKEVNPEGPQTVEGVLRPLRGKRTFSPDNQPEKNLWFHEDIGAMEKHTGLSLLPMVVEATGARHRGVYPMPGDGRISLRNDHLGYAITWFALALVAIVMFAFYHREPKA